MSDQPSKQEIAEFVEAFKKLDRYEAQQRTIRGYGVFRPEECPVPAVVKTLAWLKDLAA